ncbi:hypothetical protein JCM11641_003845 [Rhodosporidiobolus odoratus]
MGCSKPDLSRLARCPLPAAETIRKGQAKASAKFEPLVFRDALVKHLSSSPPNDYDAISNKLDSLGSQLDYRKYEEQLFQILLVGAILSPGGNIDDNGIGRCSFSIVSVGGESDKLDMKEMRKAVGVFERLMRRYKYLQHDFEETSLPRILGYVGRLTATEQQRLAGALVLFFQTGQVPASVLSAVRSVHLVKEGTAQTFLLSFLSAYKQTGESFEPMFVAFRKAGLADLDGFFSPGKRAAADVTGSLRAAGLGTVADWFVKTKTAGVRDEVTKRAKTALADGADADEVLSVLEPIAARSIPSVISDSDFVSLVFLALVSRLDLNAEGANVVDSAVKQVKDYAPVFEAFAQKAVCEVSLINTIQVYVHENPKVQPGFLRILKTLVSEDVVSSGPLSFWYNKGSKPQGREVLREKARPLVEFLEQQEEEEESDEE